MQSFLNFSKALRLQNSVITLLEMIVGMSVNQALGIPGSEGQGQESERKG